MQEKLIVVLVIVALAVGFSFVANFWEKNQVVTGMREVLNPNNTHTFKDRTGVEDALYEIAVKVVGEDANPEVYLYHYQGVAYVQDIDVDALPKYGGVARVGDQVKLSALVARIWWDQKLVWYKPVDVSATKAVFVDAGKLGFGYESPSSDDFDFVDKPWLLLDSAQ